MGEAVEWENSKKLADFFSFATCHAHGKSLATARVAVPDITGRQFSVQLPWTFHTCLTSISNLPRWQPLQADRRGGVGQTFPNHGTGVFAHTSRHLRG